MPYKIYVDFALDGDLLQHLKSNTQGHELLLPKNPASCLSMGEAEDSILDADIIFGQPRPEDVAKSESIKWIQISSSGYTRYDTPEFRALMQSRGMMLTNSASVYNEACADHLLSSMLAQSRLLPYGLLSQAATGSDEWLKLRSGSIPLRGQRVVILGYGAIGKRLVQLLAPYEMQLSAYRRTPRGDEGIPVLDTAGLPAALAKAEHIVNILPDSPATRSFFDSDRFAQCRRGAVFYNIGRGTTVDQTSLADALKSGPIRQAWLDVTDPEPLPKDHELRLLPNCFITPHTAGGFNGEMAACLQHFIENLSRFAHNEDLKDRVI